MATQALVSPEEYLSTSFDGADREYVDGLIVERNVGESPHSEVQGHLIEIFYELRKLHPLFCRPELRLKLAPTRYRIPDLAVFHPHKPTELVPDQPPLVLIEIVSREDRYTEVLKKLEEYREWGALHIWVVDPWRRTLSVYGKEGLITVSSFAIDELGIDIPHAEILP